MMSIQWHHHRRQSLRSILSILLSDERRVKNTRLASATLWKFFMPEVVKEVLRFGRCTFVKNQIIGRFFVGVLAGDSQNLWVL